MVASGFLDDVNSPQSAQLSPIGRAGTGWIPKVSNQNQWIQVQISFCCCIFISIRSSCQCVHNNQFDVNVWRVGYEINDNVQSYVLFVKQLRLRYNDLGAKICFENLEDEVLERKRKIEARSVGSRGPV